MAVLRQRKRRAQAQNGEGCDGKEAALVHNVRHEKHLQKVLGVCKGFSGSALAQGVSARHTIHVSCACVFDLSSTLFALFIVSLIFYFILLIFHFIFYVGRFGENSLVRFREWGVWLFGQQRPSHKKAKKQTVRELSRKTPDSIGAKLLIASTAWRAYRNKHLGTLMRCCEAWKPIENCVDAISFVLTSRGLVTLLRTLLVKILRNVKSRDIESPLDTDRER